MLNSGGTTDLILGGRDTTFGMNPGYVEDFPTALPHTHVDQHTNGAAFNEGIYELSDSGFHVTTRQARPASLDSNVITAGRIYFSVTGDTAYNASGYYNTLDPNSQPNVDNVAEFQVKLTDISNLTVLFDNFQRSESAANEAFTLGQLGGDFSNYINGSLTGVLTAGHNYQLYYWALTYAANRAWDVSADGQVNLDLTSAAIPEPSTLVIWSLLGGIGAIVRRRRRKRAE